MPRWLPRRRLLFMEPSLPRSDDPVIDKLTRKMAAAYRAGHRDSRQYYGLHECVCGALSKSYDTILPSGLITNSLCVHYLAFHRAEVPLRQRWRVALLRCGEVDPTDGELRGGRPSP